MSITPKIIVLSAVHAVTADRKEICHFFSRRMEAVRNATGIETLIVGSEGQASRDIVEPYGHHYVEFDNKPLSRKFNAGLEAVCNLKPDYVMILGSDDIVSTSLFEDYQRLLKDNTIDLLGVKDIYFLGLNKKRWGFGVCGYWEGRNNMLGVARCYSSRILDHCNWNLWYDDRNAGMDAAGMVSVKRYSQATGHLKSMTFNARESGHMVIDIKTRGNISSMSNFELEETDYNSLFNAHLPEEEARDIIDYCDTKIALHAGV